MPKNQGAAENVFEFTPDHSPRRDHQDANVSETDKVLRERGELWIGLTNKN